MIRALSLCLFALVALPAAAAETIVTKLADFVAQPGPIRLDGASARTDIFLPLSGRLAVLSASLELRYSNSIALIAERSVLTVSVNGTSAGQVRLRPEPSTGLVSLDIPPDLLRPGFNRISLAASQHYLSTCEDPGAPELWTEIDTSRSNLRITAMDRATEPSLAALDRVFGPGLGAIREIDLVGPAQSAGQLRALSLTAQALALRAQYEAVSFGHATAPKAASDHVLVGTAEALGDLLSSDELGLINGPVLAILPGDDLRLLVSGRDEAEVLMAARGLALSDLSLVDAALMEVRAITQESNGAKPGAAAQILPEHIYTLADLGQRDTTFRGGGSQELALDITLPPDIYAEENAAVRLGLDFTYGPGMGPGSVLNILLDGRILRGIPLSQVNGEAFRDYQIYVPLRLFKPGRSRLTFEAVTTPPTVAGECAAASERHLALTLFASSTIEMPPAGRVAAQPNLQLFAQTSFPYDGPQSVDLVMTSADALPAALTLAGKLAQVSRAPLEHLSPVYGTAEQAAGNAILLAARSDLPNSLFDQAALALGEDMRLPYPLLGENLGRQVDTVLSALGFGQAAQAATPGYVSQRHDLGAGMAVAAMRAPDGSAATLTIITAEDEIRLVEGMERLISPAIWGQLSGDMAFLAGQGERVSSLSVGSSYQIGRSDPFLALRFAVSRAPWLWIGASFAAIVLLALVSLRLLARRRRNLSVPEE